MSVKYIKSQILHLQCSAKIVGNFDKVHMDIIKKLLLPEQTVPFLFTGIVYYSHVYFIVVRFLH